MSAYRDAVSVEESRCVFLMVGTNARRSIRVMYTHAVLRAAAMCPVGTENIQ